MFKLALLCGGPSEERGISLNSARSILDHLAPQGIEIDAIYINSEEEPYAISTAQLYSNTPSDFDFKLRRSAKPLREKEYIARLQSADLVFPAIHGRYGEDGRLQQFLEDNGIPYVGPPAAACRKMFDKYEVAQTLKANGFPTLPQLRIQPGQTDWEGQVAAFFEEHNLQRAIVKPTQGGSSIDVFSVEVPAEAVEKISYIISKNNAVNAVLEPFCEGLEFTTILTQNQDGQAVCFMPTEIAMNYEGNQIFDYRRKYLSTNQVERYCPPRLPDNKVEEIMSSSSKIYEIFGVKGFARFDGWVLPDGQIIYVDLNPISGMEQNSFFFQQPAWAGMSHADYLFYIIECACKQAGIAPPQRAQRAKGRQPVNILFGGTTAERQVSVMSGTNVWLKLESSADYRPELYLLQGESVWRVPYAVALSHTVEEILQDCERLATEQDRIAAYTTRIRQQLGLSADYAIGGMPEKLSFEEFMKKSASENAFVFLALHGGAGENGDIQEQLDKLGLAYNGSGPAASRLCMDKKATGEVITAMAANSIGTAPKLSIAMSDFASQSDWQALWQQWKDELGTDSFIIKPQGDGCSAGIVRLMKPEDFAAYVSLIKAGKAWIPSNTFAGQPDPIEMPAEDQEHFLVEAFIETDKILTTGGDLDYRRKTGWIELTIGIREQGGEYHALNPSITLASGEVLSLEEKFQGGTGVNITPPPAEIVAPDLLVNTKERMVQVAQALGIQNYARIDFFLNTKSGEIIVIEANSLPGLTPSTVIYHQGLAEPTPQVPREFLENIIADARQDRCGQDCSHQTGPGQTATGQTATG